MPFVTVLREKTTLQENVVKVICNACGEEAEPGFGGSMPGFHVIRLSGGWGDHFPGDMETIEIVACDDCLESWVKTFKHPDVTVAAYGDLPRPVKHHETGETWIFEAGWVRPEGTEWPEGLPNLMYPDEEYPHDGVWEHFKGKRYAFVGLANLVDTHEWVVVYQALYGDSEVWFRPLSQWFETVDRPEIPYNGPRFRKVG